MKNIHFYKMSGSGNDFIIINNRNNIVDVPDLKMFVSKVCERKMSVGADGLILIENSDIADFSWQFFNSDGSIAEMCGNGARCAAHFAYVNQIAKSDMCFETLAGIVSASIKDQRVKIRMSNTVDIKSKCAIELEDSPLYGWSLNVGVPHVVIEVEDVNKVDVVKLGKQIRNHKQFSPTGTNVNFMSPLWDGTNAVRTYERGVEDETLACGTGSIACALVMAYTYSLESPINITTRSKSLLSIYFTKQDNQFSDIYLEGDARIIYKADLSEDAWEY